MPPRAYACVAVAQFERRPAPLPPVPRRPAEERWAGGGGLRIAAAPSLGSREIAQNNGFNAVEILRDRDRLGQRTHQVLVRRFVRQGERNWIEHPERMGPFVPCT